MAKKLYDWRRKHEILAEYYTEMVRSWKVSAVKSDELHLKTLEEDFVGIYNCRSD